MTVKKIKVIILLLAVGSVNFITSGNKLNEVDSASTSVVAVILAKLIELSLLLLLVTILFMSRDDVNFITGLVDFR